MAVSIFRVLVRRQSKRSNLTRLAIQEWLSKVPHSSSSAHNFRGGCLNRFIILMPLSEQSQHRQRIVITVKGWLLNNELENTRTLSCLLDLGGVFSIGACSKSPGPSGLIPWAGPQNFDSGSGRNFRSRDWVRLSEHRLI